MIVLSSYPLSVGNLEALGLPDDTCFLTLNTLRLKSPVALVRALRRARGERLRIVLQESTERAVLPLMSTLSALVPVRRREVQELCTGRIEPLGRVRAAFGVLGIVSATLAGHVALWRLRRASRALLRAAPLEFGRVDGVRALYLKTNLMLGAKAGGSIGHIAGVINDLHARDPGMLLLAPEFPPMVEPGVRFMPVPALQAYGLPAEVNHFRFNAPCVATGMRALQEERFDFVYQRLTLGNFAGVLLSRRHRVPLVVEYNGSEVWVARHWGYRLKFEKLASDLEDVCLRHAHRVIAVSRVLADELVERGVPRERVVWYPNGIDPKQFDPQRHAEAGRELRARAGFGQDDVVCVFIGTFGAWHGAEVLAQAAQRCLAGGVSGGPRLRFVFVGDGLRLPAVRELLAAEAGRGDVVFTGLVPQHEAPGWLAASDIYCSPHVPPADGSAFFGSPTKLFEYMAMGGAIVASDLEQIGEVLTPALREASLATAQGADGATAVLLPPGDAEALARTIQLLAADPALRRRLGQAARARALEHYTWRRHVDVIVDSLR